MGFLDKLKEAGKGVVKGVLTMAATPYGRVVVGKHQICKVSMNNSHDKIVFIKVVAIEAEYTIRDEVESFSVWEDNDAKSHHLIKIVFKSGEHSIISLSINKDQGRALPSAAQRVAAQYRNAGVLVKALAKNVPEISDDTKQWVNKIMRFCGNSPLF